MEDSGARGVRKSCRARGSYNRHGSDSSPKHASALVVPESARKKRKELSPAPGTPCSACRDPAGDESIQTAPTTQRPRREPRFTDPQVVGSSPGAPPPPPGTAPAVCGFSKLLASTGATLQAQESAGAVAAASATQQRSPSIWCVSDGEQLCTPAANSLCSAASVRSGPPCSIETHTHAWHRDACASSLKVAGNEWRTADWSDRQSLRGRHQLRLPNVSMLATCGVEWQDAVVYMIGKLLECQVYHVTCRLVFCALPRNMQPNLVAFKAFVEQKTRERVQCSLLNRVLVVLHRMRLENELQ
jgi:hypothetical protein